MGSAGINDGMSEQSVVLHSPYVTLFPCPQPIYFIVHVINLCLVKIYAIFESLQVFSRLALPQKRCLFGLGKQFPKKVVYHPIYLISRLDLPPKNSHKSLRCSSRLAMSHNYSRKSRRGSAGVLSQMGRGFFGKCCATFGNQRICAGLPLGLIDADGIDGGMFHSINDVISNSRISWDEIEWCDRCRNQIMYK